MVGHLFNGNQIIVSSLGWSMFGFICLLVSWSLGDAWICSDTVHYLAIPEVVEKSEYNASGN